MDPITWQDNQLEPIYNRSVLIQNVAWKTFQERWTIEMSGERGSGRSMLAAQNDDDDMLRALNKMEIDVWRLKSKHGNVRHTVWGLVRAQAYFCPSGQECTHSWALFVVKARSVRDGLWRMLFSSCYLAEIRSTIWQARVIIPKILLPDLSWQFVLF